MDSMRLVTGDTLRVIPMDAVMRKSPEVDKHESRANHLAAPSRFPVLES